MKKIYSIIVLMFSIFVLAQSPYRASYEIKNDLVHTKLSVKFDFQKEHLLGKAEITASPYFYSQNTLELDAKAMLIHSVSLASAGKLPFKYDGKKLIIDLKRTYQKGQKYTVVIDYTARPNEVKENGGAAITSAKGLYFIDPRGEDPEKPTQIWTQGEPESNSCWFPTIDSPNQRMTQEMLITVPSKFVTLSNGKLISKKNNAGGTRTDYWKHDKPHTPYLFFMGIGEFNITQDTWKGKKVDYYLEKEYAPYAKEIFGMTPEMMTFFSNKFGYEYPWDKYSQIVVRDYVSGAMENTTAVIHSESAHQKHGSLVDENTWEDVIAHELVHHWFGDLVTTESWSNITVNESFANYGEYLWREYKYGQDHAEAHKEEDLEGYFKGEHFGKDLVRHSYDKIQDVFDAVSYNKGGYILHMLRKYLGDKAFFEGLELYLRTHQYKTGEAHQLRLAFEQVSGKDLNWFFNQWYYGNGHPKLKVSTTESGSFVEVKIIQSQSPVFEFPLQIDVYQNGKPVTHDVWVQKKQIQTIKLPKKGKVNFVNVNANHALLAEIEHQKLPQEYLFQYTNGKMYGDRKIALEELSKMDVSVSKQVMLSALNDKYYGIRILALDKLSEKSLSAKEIQRIEQLAKTDVKTLVKAKAIEVLSKKSSDTKYQMLYKTALKSESFAMAASGLKAMMKVSPSEASLLVKNIDFSAVDGELKYALVESYIGAQDVSKLEPIAENLSELLLKTYSNQDLTQVFLKGFGFVMMSKNDVAISKSLIGFESLFDRYGKYENFKANLLGLMKQAQLLQQRSGASAAIKNKTAALVSKIEK